MIPGFLLSPIARKVGVYLAIALAAGFSLKVYGARQYAAGVEASREASSQEIQKAAKQARDLAIAQVQTERVQLDADRQVLVSAREQFDRDRRQLDAHIRSHLDSIAVAAKTQMDAAARVSDPDLPDAIRKELLELAR